MLISGCQTYRRCWSLFSFLLFSSLFFSLLLFSFLLFSFLLFSSLFFSFLLLFFSFLSSSFSFFLPTEHSDLDSITRTDTSLNPDLPGLRGWTWELAYLYAESMTSVCLHGNTSIIQKTALLGNEANRKVMLYKKESRGSGGLGLVDLLKLTFPEDTCKQLLQLSLQFSGFHVKAHWRHARSPSPGAYIYTVSVSQPMPRLSYF